MGQMTAAHFIFIPAVLIIGMVIGWILALAPRKTRLPRNCARRRAPEESGSISCMREPLRSSKLGPPHASRLARLAGSPATRILRCGGITG